MRHARPFVFLASIGTAALVVGCDTATVYEACSEESKVGTGEERCMPSTFSKEAVWARATLGFVTSGIEPVPNAVVRIDGMTATTDGAGLYRFDTAPFRYDVLARLDHDVINYKGAAARFIDLSVERDIAPRAWTARVAITVPNGPRPGNALAVFAGGNIVGATGGVDGGLVLASRSFDIAAKIHVVEYPPDVGIVGAIGKGSAEVFVQGNGAAATQIELAPVEATQTTSFDAAVPPGFVAEEAEVILDFGSRLSEALARRVPLGAPMDLPVMEEAGWTVRVRATRAGAVASSGRVPFALGNAYQLTLFDAPEAVAPEAEQLVVDGVLRARGVGVFEHVLTPLEGTARTIRIVTASPETTIPDLTGVGAPPAKGRYTWTVRHFPDFAFVDAISGIDVRLYRAVSASAPRTVVLP